jgi:ASC-1-like (ASCH) protein
MSRTSRCEDGRARPRDEPTAAISTWSPTASRTIGVRVQDPNLRNLKADDHIWFVCGRDDALTKVKRVDRYTSFEEMLDTEGQEKVNPTSPRDQQLANIRRIYGPDKEALGVLAIEIELVTEPT